MTGGRGGSASGPFGRRRTSLRARLVRAGFVEIDRAGSCLHDEALSRLLPLAQAPLDGDGLDPVRVALVEELGATADPDLALLSLARLASAVGARGEELRELFRPLGADRGGAGGDRHRCAEEDDPDAVHAAAPVSSSGSDWPCWSTRRAMAPGIPPNSKLPSPRRVART